MIKDEFSASLLQSSVSHSEIILKYWFAVQETFLHIIIIIINFKTVEYFFMDSSMNRKIQRSAFIWNKKLL